MSLIPWKQHRGQDGSALADRPQDVLRQMRREFDSLFERFFGDWPMTFTDHQNMGWDCDIDDQANEIVVRAEAPGFDAGDFNLEIAGSNLVLQAEHKTEEKTGNGSHFRQQLYRSVSLPQGVEADKVAAVYRNGVLEIRIPKAEHAAGKWIEMKPA
jgi:HSP20 family protein